MMKARKYEILRVMVEKLLVKRLNGRPLNLRMKDFRLWFNRSPIEIFRFTVSEMDVVMLIVNLRD